MTCFFSAKWCALYRENWIFVDPFHKTCQLFGHFANWGQFCESPPRVVIYRLLKSSADGAVILI